MFDSDLSKTCANQLISTVKYCFFNKLSIIIS